MENGYVILGIVALLFLSMYGYSYWSVFREKMAQKKIEEEELKRREIRRERRLKNQALIDAKVNAFNKRKEEIRQELQMLKKSASLNEQQKVS
ncbi:hypothetical protein [Neotamlana laminarinivorans]|uniref:Uncharacterized protein n=1 Tax=Neotamlana laminarinivorans TaxID=2883124 RepID=A0A9X1I4T9_9FLAO|nr:hypothetical protein [Tamlana laminarinivorans]MCB4800004.1 hypothetical protein [Tamlana laminarinivorans]